MIAGRRTTSSGFFPTGSGCLRRSHNRPRTFIGVMFVPLCAKYRKITPGCANRALGRDLLKGCRMAA